MPRNKKVTLKLHSVSVFLSKKKGWVTRSLPFSPNKRQHWAVRSKWTNAWKEEVGAVVLEHRKEFGKLPLDFPKVTITLRSTKPMDKDNRYASVKQIIDGLKTPKFFSEEGAGVIKDDRDEDCEISVISDKVLHKEDEGVIIEVEF